MENEKNQTESKHYDKIVNIFFIATSIIIIIIQLSLAFYWAPKYDACNNIDLAPGMTGSCQSGYSIIVGYVASIVYYLGITSVIFLFIELVLNSIGKFKNFNYFYILIPIVLAIVHYTELVEKIFHAIR